MYFYLLLFFFITSLSTNHSTSLSAGDEVDGSLAALSDKFIFRGTTMEIYRKLWILFSIWIKNPVIETPCGPYNHDLIYSRRQFKILIVATKLTGGVNIFLTLQRISLVEMNKPCCIIWWCIGIMNVRSIDVESLIRWMQAWADLKIPLKSVLWVIQKIVFFRKCLFSQYYDFVFWFL